jgi:CCR4-NOT transcription complex subunit 1
VDAFSKLVVLLVKHADRLNASKITFLKNVLSVVYHVLVRDLEVRRKYTLQFDQRVYYRFFANLIQELSFPDPALDTSNFQVLHVFGELLHMLQPVNVPAFSFAWLSLISHRKLMPSMLNGKNQNQGWQVFMMLLVDLFQFLGIFLRAPPRADIASGSLRNLFKGTLRVMLVLLHDFPEFVYSNHVAFCDVIPTSCIQLRNLVLSACPRNARLPDPFTPNLKVDLLPDIAHVPQVVNHHMHALTSSGLLPEMDAYIRQLRNDPAVPNSGSNSVPQTLLREIRNKLLLSPEQQYQVGTKYNVPLLNALVLYFGMQAIQLLQKKATGTGTQYYMDLYLQMTNMLDAEGNYLFLNALANQLRYPNKHTHYFSCVLLCLFTETSQEALKEQIARVLLERLIVNRPHPWGLLITFIELIKNPIYNIWSYDFIRCAPDIERLFDNVARSCTPHSDQSGEKTTK